MVIFHSYVSLPEGNPQMKHRSPLSFNSAQVSFGPRSPDPPGLPVSGSPCHEPPTFGSGTSLVSGRHGQDILDTLSQG